MVCRITIALISVVLQYLYALVLLYSNVCTIAVFSLSLKSTSCVFPPGWCFFYLVTAGWISDMSFIMHVRIQLKSTKKKNNIAVCRPRRPSGLVGNLHTC